MVSPTIHPVTTTLDQAKQAYFAIPERFRDLCADRENALGHDETSATFWIVMANSALSRQQDELDQQR